MSKRRPSPRRRATALELNRALDRLIDQRANGFVNAPDYAEEKAALERQLHEAEAAR